MFASGLVEEMRSLLAAGHPAESKAFEAIGYREALLFIRGEIGLPGAIRLTQAATRQYAKRQMTWFRRDPEIHWIRGFGNKSQTIETAFGLVEKQKNIST
jgi:tRNA dimethylallyltransferase